MAELLTYFAVRDKYELHLILYGIKREIFYDVNKNVIIHKPAFKFNNNFRLFFTFRTLLYLRKEIKNIKPDSILSFGELWNSFVLLATIGLRSNIYISDRCNPQKKYKIFNSILRKMLYKKATGIIAQTNKAAAVYKELFKNNNISVIGNPIREIKQNGIKKENIVLTVGRLIETKHHDLLIKMFLNSAPPDWKLIIVGDDAQKQKNKIKLERLIYELNAKERVFLIGTQKNIDEFYLRSKIFAFTSSSEGFPNVIGEAQAAGLPVISFDCIAGPSDLIEDGKNGFLIPLFEQKMFEDKLRLLISDENLRERLGNSAKETIKKFSVSAIGDKFEKFILTNAYSSN